MKKMAKLAVAGSVLAMSAAQAAPTIYGQLNKEYRMVDQDNTYYTKSAGVVDVENGESRFGFKGTEEVGAMKANYVLELGFNSSNNSVQDGPGRDRIRIASLNFEHAFGTLMLGQQSTITAGAFGAFDPMKDSVAGLTADDHQLIYDNATSGGLGFNNRSRKDILGYKTPEFMGLSFATTLDRSDKNGTAAQYQTRDPMYWENLLTYKNKFGDFGVTLHAGYMKWNQQDSSANRYIYNDEKQMAFGAQFKFMDFSLAGTMTKMSHDQILSTNAVKNEFKTDWMSVAAEYKFLEKNYFAVTYAKKEIDQGSKYDTDGTTWSDTGTTQAITNSEETQMAFGLKHKYSDNLEMRLTYATYEYKRKLALTTGEETGAQTTANNKWAAKTDASVIALGTMLKF